MKTRLMQWLDMSVKRGPKSTRGQAQVLYGVDVFVDGRWRHACRDGKPLLFSDRGLADAERAKLRATKP